MKAISELMLGKISKKGFLRENRILRIDEMIEQNLDEAYKTKDADGLEELIYLIFKFEAFNNRYVDVLNHLLITDWHFQHENIVLLLEKISCLDSINFLYDAIELKPKYLSCDENYAFEVKCVRAIYYIGKEKSFSYLQKLCGHSNDVIKEMAQRQIKKLM